MKKFKTEVFISAVALLFALGFICGLSGDKNQTTKQDSTGKQEKQTGQDKSTQKKDDFKIIHKEIKDSNKTLNYELSITYPQIDGNGPQDKFNTYMTGLMNAQADTFRADMKTWDQKSEYGSEFEITDTVMFINPNLISVSFSIYSSFAGTAHPSHSSMSVNYDLKNNKALKLSDMFTGNYLNVISENSIKQIVQQKKENEPGEKVDMSTIKDGAGPDEKNFRSFNVTSDTLYINFDEYQVGAYAEGDFFAQIPYSTLKSVINPSGPLKDFVK